MYRFAPTGTLQSFSSPKIPRDHPKIKYVHSWKERDYRTEFRSSVGRYVYTTACGRRYIGTWEIKHKKLFLRHIIGRYELLGGDPLFADWYSGTLLLPAGPMLHDGHHGYGNVFLRVHLIRIQAGQVTKTKNVWDWWKLRDRRNNWKKLPPEFIVDENGTCLTIKMDDAAKRLKNAGIRVSRRRTTLVGKPKFEFGISLEGWFWHSYIIAEQTTIFLDFPSSLEQATNAVLNLYKLKSHVPTLMWNDLLSELLRLQNSGYALRFKDKHVIDIVNYKQNSDRDIRDIYLSIHPINSFLPKLTTTLTMHLDETEKAFILLKDSQQISVSFDDLKLLEKISLLDQPD